MSIALHVEFSNQVAANLETSYVYPLLDILSFQQRTFLFAGCAVWLTLFFVVIRSVYGKVNGYGIPVAKTAKKTN